VVGQAAAGLILTYSHTLKAGEYVRIGEHEGTVTEVGMFNTTIRTGLGEVLTLPNSMITGSVTKNYSRVGQGAGYIVDTVVTIGYDTPWRQVEAILVEAAERTEGILRTPRPRCSRPGCPTSIRSTAWSPRQRRSSPNPGQSC
jgi:small-conductance mechanosensitive channel